MWKSIQVLQGRQGSYTLSWSIASSDVVIEVFGGKSPSSIDRSKTLATAKGSATVTISGLDPAHRWYFEVSQPGGPGTIVAERRIELTGAFNFRDLGGYPTSGGAPTRWGYLFRSDALNKLTAEDVGFLSNIGVKLVVDLRTDEEVAREPDVVFTDSRTAYRRRPILLSFSLGDIKANGNVWTEGDMLERLRSVIDLNAGTFAHVFEDIADRSGGVVFHCAGGKDRTGIASALVLMAVGVSDDVIVQDFALSDQYIAAVAAAREQRLKASGIDPTLLGPMLKSPPSVMRGALDHLWRRYGTVDAYLQSGGLSPTTLSALRAKFVWYK